MKELEIETFIEELEALGDPWTNEQVKQVYGDLSLEEALSKRRSELSLLSGIVGTLLSR